MPWRREVSIDVASSMARYQLTNFIWEWIIIYVEKTTKRKLLDIEHKFRGQLRGRGFTDSSSSLSSCSRPSVPPDPHLPPQCRPSWLACPASSHPEFRHSFAWPSHLTGPGQQLQGGGGTSGQSEISYCRQPSQACSALSHCSSGSN